MFPRSCMRRPNFFFFCDPPKGCEPVFGKQWYRNMVKFSNYLISYCTLTSIKINLQILRNIFPGCSESAAAPFLPRWLLLNRCLLMACKLQSKFICSVSRCPAEDQPASCCQSHCDTERKRSRSGYYPNKPFLL